MHLDLDDSLICGAHLKNLGIANIVSIVLLSYATHEQTVFTEVIFISCITNQRITSYSYTDAYKHHLMLQIQNTVGLIIQVKHSR